MKKLYVSYDRASYLVKKTDKYRAAYYKYYTFGKKWNNPLNYDLMLNTSKMTYGECVDIISKLVNERFA